MHHRNARQQRRRGDLEAQIERAISDSSRDWDGLDPSKHYVGLEPYLREFFATLPRWATRRLAEADGEAPTSATVAILGQALGLDATEVRLLDYLEQREFSEPLREFLRAGHGHGPFGDRGVTARVNMERLATMLALDAGAVRAALAKRSPLQVFGLVDLARHNSDLEDFLFPSDLLGEVMAAAPPDADALLELLIEPAPVAAWRLEAFPHLADQVERLRVILRQAATRGAAGVNALFHGAPGTGKTELARALSEASGLRAYQVRSADDDGDGLRREGRLSAYLLAQRLLAKCRDAVLIFDEIEDIFATGGDLLALLSGRRAPGRQKGRIRIGDSTEG